MDAPPRRVGKRLIGRYLFLRIALGTILLTGFVVGSVFWAQSLGKTDSQCRAQALSVLNLGACAVTVSARFTYNSSFHPRIFRDNKYCWYSILIVIVLQVAIIYIPGLNYYVFKMRAMDADQWGITALFMFFQFVGMEAEKAFRRYLKSKGADTDDRELTVIDRILADADKQGQTGSFRAESKHDIASFRSVELHR
mmetsp:Transcript_29678/g.36119  ORF Transcript_29678/g.36119 Transcript_29678/m.36119 type:complete len:196 (+) Transcript_29678:117-704(+)